MTELISGEKPLSFYTELFASARGGMIVDTISQLDSLTQDRFIELRKTIDFVDMLVTILDENRISFGIK